MVFGLSDEQIKKMNKELVNWVKKELESNEGSYLFEILWNLKQMIENKKKNE